MIVLEGSSYHLVLNSRYSEDTSQGKMVGSQNADHEECSMSLKRNNQSLPL